MTAERFYFLQGQPEVDSDFWEGGDALFRPANGQLLDFDRSGNGDRTAEEGKKGHR